MPVFKTTVIPTATYPPDTYPFGPLNVQNGAFSFVIVFDKTAWTDPAVTLAVTMEISLDNGQTWNPHPDGDPFPVSYTDAGGGTDKFGNPLLVSTLSSSLPAPQNNQRRLRGTAIVAGGSLTTSAEIQVNT